MSVLNEVKKIAGTARHQLAYEGVVQTAKTAADFAYSTVAYPFSEARRNPGVFEFFGRSYAYARFGYPNRPWRNERSVELALGLDFLERHRGKSLLEVGNVLSQYTEVQHDIVDKYEVREGVQNVDVVDIPTEHPWEAVLALSTLEHVGWHEEPRDPDKVWRAYLRIREVMAPGGVMMVTCPLGQNPHLDELIFAERLKFGRTGFLKRVSKDNQWREATADEVRGAEYGRPFRNANAVFVGVDDPELEAR